MTHFPHPLTMLMFQEQLLVQHLQNRHLKPGILYAKETKSLKLFQIPDAKGNKYWMMSKRNIEMARKFLCTFCDVPPHAEGWYTWY